MVRSLLSLRKEMFLFLFFSPPLTYSAPSLSLSLLSRSQEHSICAALSNGQFFALGVGVIKVKLSTQRKALYQLRKQSASETLYLKPLFIRTVCASLLLHAFPLSLFCSSYLLLRKKPMEECCSKQGYLSLHVRDHIVLVVLAGPLKHVWLFVLRECMCWRACVNHKGGIQTLGRSSTGLRALLSWCLPCCLGFS